VHLGVLDVTFQEDDSRVYNRTTARNLALSRKIALNTGVTVAPTLTGDTKS
jgi:predicted transposase YbfD/YdcC